MVFIIRSLNEVNQVFVCLVSVDNTGQNRSDDLKAKNNLRSSLIIDPDGYIVIYLLFLATSRVAMSI